MDSGFGIEYSKLSKGKEGIVLLVLRTFGLRRGVPVLARRRQEGGGAISILAGSPIMSPRKSLDKHNQEAYIGNA